MITHSPEQAAIASELVRQLDTYENGLRELLQRRWDPDLYRALSDVFDEMQMQATLLPKLGVSWTELMITRVDLTHALHKVLIDEVRRKCLEYVAKGERFRA